MLPHADERKKNLALTEVFRERQLQAATEDSYNRTRNSQKEINLQYFCHLQIKSNLYSFKKMQNKQEAQQMLTNPHDALEKKSTSRKVGKRKYVALVY